MIKVGFCVAYDWYFLKNAIPMIYESADTICLSIDAERKSWVGNPFTFDETGFKEILKELDKDNKIKILEADFHLPDLAPMQNEVRQRKMMADFMGQGGWHIQLDADEYFLDFKGFTKYLKTLKFSRPTNVCCPWITLYKQVEEGFLMVQPEKFRQIEFIPIATNQPHYEYGRRNGYFNHYSPFPILHQSWARTPEEVWQKLSNWGHRFDADIEQHFALWKNASINNYTTYRNFNQNVPDVWPKLELLKVKNNEIKSLLHSDVIIPLELPPVSLMLKNSIWVSRINKVLLSIKSTFSR